MIKRHFLLGFICLVAIFLLQVDCQGECPELNNNIPEGMGDSDRFLGTQDTMSENGIISTILNTDGDVGVSSPSVMIDAIRVVCLSQHQRQDRYTYASVVVSFYCSFSDPRVTECQDSTVLNTQQFEFGCNNGEWVRTIFSEINQRTTSPTATLSTDTNFMCRYCLNPARNTGSLLMGLEIDSVDHCSPCINCTEGLQRCYGGFGNQKCCVFFHGGECVDECPGLLEAAPDFTCQCSELSDANGVFSFTNDRLPDSVATLVCNAGYELGGASQATCGVDNDWSATPSCIRVDCGDVDVVSNADISYSDGTTRFGSMASYICDDGYYLEGPSPRTCTSTKAWSPALTMATSCDLCSDKLPGCLMCSPGTAGGDPTCDQCEEGFDLQENGECKGQGGTGASSCDIACIIGIILAIIAVIIITIVVVVVAFVLYKYLNDPATKLAKTDTGGLNGVARDNPLYVDPAAVTDDGLDVAENGVNETTPLEV